jgi:hypothetical protein
LLQKTRLRAHASATYHRTIVGECPKDARLRGLIQTVAPARACSFWVKRHGQELVQEAHSQPQSAKQNQLCSHQCQPSRKRC